MTHLLRQRPLSTRNAMTSPKPIRMDVFVTAGINASAPVALQATGALMASEKSSRPGSNR